MKAERLRTKGRQLVAAGALLLLILPGWVHAFQPELQDEAVKQMRPGSGIEAERGSWWSSWPTWLMVGGLGLVAAAVGAGLALRLTRVRPMAGAPSAHQAALRELQRLEGMDFPEPGALARQHTELSNVIRRYLEQRFRSAATRQTTPEFLATMRTSQLLTADQQALLREFLEQCDLAKFAGVLPSFEQSRAMAAAARSFVEQTAAVG